MALIPKYDRVLGASREDDTSGEVPATRTLTIVGTTNQVSVTPTGAQDLSADRTWTLSTPQNIAPTSSPTFASLTLTNPLTIGNGGTNTTSQTTNGVAYFDGTRITTNSSDTYDGTTFRIGKSFSWSDNTQAVPAPTDGGALGWNFDGGQAAVDIWNCFTGFTPGFAWTFKQKTGPSTYVDYVKIGAQGMSLMLPGNNTFFFGSGADRSIDGNTANRLTLTGDLSVNAHVANGTVDEAGISVTKSVNTNSNNSHVFYGLQFTAQLNGSANYTNTSPGGVLGLYGVGEHHGTGIASLVAGGFAYAANTNTGTTIKNIGFNLYPTANTGGGTITDDMKLLIGGVAAVTVNNQTRSGHRFDTAMPSPGAFTGTTVQQVWFNYNGTTLRDGIGFGATVDFGMYRSAANQGTIFGGIILTAPTTAQASLNLPSGPAPTSPLEGDMWADSTQKAVMMFADGVTQSRPGVLFTQTADQTVTNTVTETTILGTGIGTTSLPVNFFVPGKTVRIRVGGIYSTPALATPSVTIKVKLSNGPPIIAQVTTSSLLSGASSLEFDGEIIITCRTTGSSGTVVVHGDIEYATGVGGTVAVDSLNNAGATSVVNTTKVNVIDVTVTWDTATSTRIAKSTVCTIEILN